MHDQSDLSYLIIKMIKRGCFEIIHIHLDTLSESISLPPKRLISKRSIFQNVYILVFVSLSRSVLNTQNLKVLTKGNSLQKCRYILQDIIFFLRI